MGNLLAPLWSVLQPLSILPRLHPHEECTPFRRDGMGNLYKKPMKFGGNHALDQSGLNSDSGGEPFWSFNGMREDDSGDHREYRHRSRNHEAAHDNESGEGLPGVAHHSPSTDGLHQRRASVK